MKNKEIARIFTEIAEYLEMEGVPFKPYAYQKAALTLETLKDDVEDLYGQGGLKALKSIPGVGESIAHKIEEYLKTGKIEYYEEFKRKLPIALDEIVAVEGVGPKKAKEIWFLCRQYDANQALEMGLINAIVPLDRLEEETVQWCREMLALSPFALRLLKASFNADEDGLAGIQQLAHDANLLFYMSEEAQEGRNAYLEKRKPDFAKFPHRA